MLFQSVYYTFEFTSQQSRLNADWKRAVMGHHLQQHGLCRRIACVLRSVWAIATEHVSAVHSLRGTSQSNHMQSVCRLDSGRPNKPFIGAVPRQIYSR